MSTKVTPKESTETKLNIDIETRLKSLEEKSHTRCDNSLEERVIALGAKVDDLISRLSRKMTF